MWGWMISVYRFADPSGLKSLTASDPSPLAHDVAADVVSRDLSTAVAVWQTGLGGLDWIQVLVDMGQAVSLPSNGYPSRFLGRAGDLLPTILQGPPDAHEHWISGPTDVIGSGWLGKTTIDRDATDSCPEDEWLLVEAWDES